jgi:hypothetical protein
VVLGGYAGGTAIGALGLTLQLLLATPVAMALCRGGRSVLAPALFHASGSGLLAASQMVKGGVGVLPLAAQYGPGLACVLILVASGAWRTAPPDA